MFCLIYYFMKINYPIIYKLSYVYTTIALSKLFLAYEEDYFSDYYWQALCYKRYC